MLQDVVPAHAEAAVLWLASFEWIPSRVSRLPSLKVKGPGLARLCHVEAMCVEDHNHHTTRQDNAIGAA